MRSAIFVIAILLTITTQRLAVGKNIIIDATEPIDKIQLKTKIEPKNIENKVAITKKTTIQPTNTTTGGNIEQIIREAARKYGIDENHLLRIAKCESAFNGTVINYGYTAADGSHPTGLFQYIRSTWIDFSTKAGYSGASIYNVEAQANVTAWAFVHGKSSHWECK